MTASLLVGAARAQDRPGTLDPLTVGEIEIITNDIFSPEEVSGSAGALRFLKQTMNTVHFNTRHHVVRRELLFHTGDVFDPDRLEETERNLRDLGFLNNVRITAVDTTADGRVTVRVNTREAWTLRTSFSYSLASGGDQRWKVQLSDGNFLGHGVTVGAGVGADENAQFWNVWYRQRRLFGAGFWLGLDYSERGDGHVRQLIFNRPFYALDDPWSSELRVWHNEYDKRYYLSHAGPAGLDPATTERLYASFAYREKGGQARFQWRLSPERQGRVWRFGGGVDVADRIFREELSAVELSDGRVEDLTWLEAEGQPFVRETGVEVYPFLWLRSTGRRWQKNRFVLQYGPVEDIPLDVEFDIRTGPVGGGVGSTTGYGDRRWRTAVAATKWFVLPDGFLFAHADAVGDLGSSRVRTYRYDGILGWVGRRGPEMSPWLTRVFAEYAQGEQLLGSEAFVLGLDRGLRTLDFDGMAGDHLVRWNIEQGKVLDAEPFGLLRAGFAAFYSGGAAWWKNEARDAGDIRHEVGFGVRFGPTRSANSQVARIDVAWDLNGDGSPVLTAITRGYF